MKSPTGRGEAATERLHLVENTADSREAHRAALNLLEDAVEAREQAERVMIALQQSEARHGFLLTLSDSLRFVDDAAEIQRITARLLGEYLGASRVTYVDVDADGDAFTVHEDYSSGVPTFVGRHRLSEFGSYVLEAFRTGQTLSVADVDLDDRISDRGRETLIANHVRASVERFPACVGP